MTEKPNIAAQLPADTPLLPRRASEERPLFIIMATMAFLAGLVLLISLVGLRATQSWQSDLARTLTVQVFPDGTTRSDELTARASEILTAQLPESRVAVMREAEARALLKPWLGDLELPQEIELPTLLRVDTGTDKPVDIVKLEEDFQNAGIDSDIDDHSRWGQNIRRTWRAVQVGMGGIILIVLGASAAVASYATHSVLRIRRTIIDVLAHVGAPDKYIITLFTRRFTAIGFVAALAGALSALLCLILFSAVTTTASVDVLPILSLTFPDLVILTVLVVVLSLISGLTAGVTTFIKLRRDRRAS